MDKIVGALRKLFYLANPVKNYIFDKMNKLPKIEWMVFEVTDACNSRCRHCNIWKNEPSREMLSNEEIYKMFADPILKDLKAVLITGGEPVLRRDLAELFIGIHKILPKVRITLSTNGLLPERVIEVVKRSIENGINMDVGISLDAVGDKNDEIRGVKGNFEKVDRLLDGLNKLNASTKEALKFNVILGHTLSPLTIDTIDEVKKFARDKGAVFLTQLYDEASYYHNIDNIEPGKDDEHKMSKVLDNLAPSLHKIFLKEILKNKMIRFNCFALRSFFVLRCTGEVVPCLQKSHISIGNIKKDPFSKIWNGAQAKAVRRGVSACIGCSNTWATNWSMKSNFIPFIHILVKYLVELARPKKALLNEKNI